MASGNNAYPGARPIGGGPIRGAGYETKREMTAAELEKKYIDIELAQEELKRRQNTPIPPPPEKRASAQEKAREAYLGEIGTATGKLQFNLPKLESTVNRALQEGAELTKHPGFEAAVGVPNPFRGGFGPIGTFPGTSARGFSDRLKQSQAGAFLQAFESLKGAGAITEKEGTRAEQALSRMNLSSSESEFRAALQDYMNVVADGLKTARQQVKLGKGEIGAGDANPYSYENVLAEQRRRAALRKQR
jgi:hypothetical protein